MENQQEMPSKHIAILAGSTGLVGSCLLKQLVQSAEYDKVHSVGRRNPDFSNEKTVAHIVDFEELKKYGEIERADDAFCCLGTTMSKAGSKESFYQVDFEYVKDFAEYSQKIGCKRFFLISALGADKDSMVYYNKVKGEIEEEVMSMSFETTHIFRPSLLIGEREEVRVGESLGQKLAQWFDFLIPKKFKAINAEEVAKFIKKQAFQSDLKDIHIHESAEMLFG
ncbi:MAG: hypothetical protein ACI85I_000154 [Arenicella sp.]|jgi:uncharacterized protein YbjT (DUF2867 family)